MHFAPQPLVTTCHVPLRNPYAPRSQGEPCQSGRRADDDDGGDDGDDSLTALTDDGTAAAERVPSENFNMQKTGPVWRGDRKENL